MEVSGSGRDNRILDRGNYERKTLDVYEIIAAYFVDLYYNHFYIEARKHKASGQYKTITEGYKHTLNGFLNSLDKPKLYKKCIVGLHTFYTNYGFTSISFTQCIERISREFVPTDYFQHLTGEQKTKIFRQVISNSNKKFIEKIVFNYIQLIIDSHDDADNIRLLQDEFIDILIMEREFIYQTFISKQTQTTSSRNNHVNSALLDTMRKEIKALYAEKYQILQLQNKLKQLLIHKDKQNRLLSTKLTEVQSELTELQANIGIAGESAPISLPPPILISNAPAERPKMRSPSPNKSSDTSQKSPKKVSFAGDLLHKSSSAPVVATSESVKSRSDAGALLHKSTGNPVESRSDADDISDSGSDSQNDPIEELSSAINLDFDDENDYF